MGGKRIQKRIPLTAADEALWAEKPYHRRARAAFPILVRQAKAEQTITYSGLAQELGLTNARITNYPLGAIGRAILELSKEWDIQIPPIQSLAVNKKTRYASDGISYAIADSDLFERSSRNQKKRMLRDMMSHVFAFDRWDDVLARFGLQPVGEVAPTPLAIGAEWQYGARGESEEHEHLKAYISKNPGVVDLGMRFGPVTVEYEFPSADVLDVLFKGRNEWVGIEVKSRKSSISDVIRGIYQCVKYEALIEAQQRVEQLRPNARVVLILENPFPSELLALKHTLGVEVVDEIHVE